jgi:ligand-binding sensor domain-containing protein/two-component sensor histidine kinase
MSKRLLIFLHVAFSVFPVFSQTLNEKKAEHLGLKDGLADASITSICQDEDGFLWIGTTNGLSKYDGVEFQNYYHTKDSNSLPGNYIRKIINLSHHRILIGDASGLSIFYTDKNIFKNLLISAPQNTFPFENNFAIIAVDAKQNIWAASQTTLYELDTDLHITQSWKQPFKPTNGNSFIYIIKIKPLAKGRVIFQALSVGNANYFMYVPEQKKIISIAELQNDSLDFLCRTSVPVRDVCFDKNENAYFMKYQVDSIFYFDLSTKKISTFFLGNDFRKDQIYYNCNLDLINDSLAGCILSGGGFLYWRHPFQPAKNYFQKNFVLAHEQPTCTFSDDEGNIWIGTVNGLYKYTLAKNYLDIVSFPQSNNKTKENIGLEAITSNADKIFISTNGGGIFYNTDTSWKNEVWNGNTNLHDVWSIKNFDKDIYTVATQQGLYEWNIHSGKHDPFAFSKNFEWINALPITIQFKDSKNIFWIGLGGSKGVAAYNLNTGDIKIYSRHGSKYFPLSYPVAVDEDEYGDIWMGGPHGIGLAKYDRARDSFMLIPPAYNTDFDNGEINAMYADHKGHLWLGTASGLVKYDIERNEFKKFNIQSGLAGNSIHDLDADANGWLWIATKNGLNCINLTSEKIINFNGFYNLSDEGVNAVHYNAADNKIYFATEHNLYCIIPGEWLVQHNQPKIFITAAEAQNKAFDVNTTSKLAHDQNNINIKFSTVNLINGKQDKYFYQLNINKDQWTALGKQRQVSFSNLAPGDYHFSVKAQTPDGEWTSNIATVSFSIADPFWETWWFILLAFILVIIIVYSLYRYRIRQLLRVQEVRNRIATDLHDDIGSALTNINILATLSSSNINNSKKAEGFLKRISEEVNKSSQSLDDIVWSINTMNDSFEQMAARMRRYAAELFEAANIHYELLFDEKLTHQKLRMEQRREIFFIFKEAVNNIYKHAQASFVEIELKQERNNFFMMIKDNGKGFDVSVQTTRNGIKNIFARTDKCKGSCNIVSGESGTTIKICMPFES